MMTLPQINEAARGLAFLVAHAPDSTPLAEVGALFGVLAYHLDQVTDRMIAANSV